MKPRLVSAVALLFCCAILAIAGAFGYSRYEASEAADAAFREQFPSLAAERGASVGTQMPGQLPPHAHTVAGEASPRPALQ